MLGLVTLFWLQLPGAAPPTPFDRVVPLEFGAATEKTAASDGGRRVEYRAAFAGTLHVWTRADGELDVDLRVEDPSGALVGEDRSSGGGTTPYLEVQVEPERRLVVRAVAAKPGATGSFALRLVAAPEDEATRRVAAAARAALVDVAAANAAQDLEAARTRVLPVIDALLAVPGGASSDLVVAAAWDACFEAYGAGDTATAERAVRVVLEHRLRILPNDHPVLQTARTIFGAMRRIHGDLPSARELFETVLAVDERTLVAEHPDVQAARLNLATVYADLGDLARARPLEDRVLELWSRTLPDDAPNLQSARQNAAGTHRALGELSSARELLEKVLEVRTHTLSEDNPSLQIARLNLAGLLCECGDFARARALSETALAHLSRVLPADHPHVQAARSALAVAQKHTGSLADARVLEETALEIQARSLAEDHPDLLAMKQNVAITRHLSGDWAGACALLEGVVAIRARTLPVDHPARIATEQNLASARLELGEVEAARDGFRAVLAARERIFPPEHPERLAALASLACAQAVTGELAEARVLASRLADSYRLATQHVAWTSSVRETEAWVANAQSNLSILLSVAGGYGVGSADVDLERRVFELLEAQRGVGGWTRALAARAEKLPALEAAREALTRAEANLVSVAYAPGAEDWLRAQRDRDRAEAELVAQIAKAVPSDRLSEPTVASLAHELRPGSALVGFHRYARSTFAADAKSRTRTEIALVAFVVSANGAFVCVELGQLSDVERAASAWREAVGASLERGLSVPVDRDGEVRRRGDALRALIFDPLRPALGDARTVTLALDDVLHAVPFDALPAGASGECLGDVYRFELRATLRELSWKERLPMTGPSLLALGGVSFNGEPLAPEVSESSGPVPEAPTSVAAFLRGGAWERGFEPLASTGTEVRSLGALFGEAFDGATTVVLEKRRASRQALERLAPRARFLHLATHGWFAPESLRCWSDETPVDPHAGLGARMSGEARAIGSSPMLVCGLALAGANLPADALGRYPGLVTAEELASLDLSNCELAVLSACDTNVGIRRAGQGVASLQMALHLAGARSVITSLWKVPDEATKELMLDFYRRLWVEKKPKWQALWEAKKKLRNAKDESGKPKYTTRDWAAWVLTGEPD
ncbi:MAG: CHAT domain-containing protein [Planctomycetes bacterium]|nr:CHAT domain-containing protein [Planctomycetota bacterium]